MPEPRFTDGPSSPSGPPPGKSVRARGPVTPPDAEDVIASLEPDDDLQALVAEATDRPVVVAPSPFVEGETILIHVREDGFTANGRVWYRGQELEFVVGEEHYQDTVDRHGKSWLSLDENDQIHQYGQVMFGRGEWPGGQYENEKASEAERRRGRTPPTIGKVSADQPMR